MQISPFPAQCPDEDDTTGEQSTSPTFTDRPNGRGRGNRGRVFDRLSQRTPRRQFETATFPGETSRGRGGKRPFFRDDRPIPAFVQAKESEEKKKIDEFQKKLAEAEEEARKARNETENLREQLKAEKDSTKAPNLKAKTFSLKCQRCDFDLNVVLKESTRYANYYCFVPKPNLN